MQFLKKHYEKIILSVVLLALGASAVWLSTAISNAKSTPDLGTSAIRRDEPKGGGSDGSGIDLRPLRASLQDMKEVPPFKLTGEHNLFNPVVWKLKPDGTLFKMTLGGPPAVSILDIRPYYYTITLEGQMGSGWYLVAQRAKQPKAVHQFYNVSPKDKPNEKKPFTVVGATGTNDSVTLQLRLLDADDLVSVSMDKPYKRIEGYDVDLDYHASDENKKIPNLTIDTPFKLSGETYKIIALTNTSLTLQDTRTQKRTTIQWSGQH